MKINIYISGEINKKAFYIELKEGMSQIKAKNLIAEKMFDYMIDTIWSDFTEQQKKDCKKETIKALKRSVYEYYSIDSISFNVESVEECFLIEKKVKKSNKEIIYRSLKHDGNITFEKCEGIRYYSTLYPNIDLYIVKIESGYALIEKYTGLSIYNTKYKKDLINDMEMHYKEKYTENEIFEQLKKAYKDLPIPQVNL